MLTPANPGGRLTNEWVSDALKSLGVASGKITDLESAPAEQIAQIKTAIAGALGIPA